MKRVLSLAMAVSLGLLLGLGVAFAIQRGLSVASADPGALDREQLEGIAAMTGWLITLGAAELWIPRTRASRPIASLHDLQPQ